MLEFIKKLDKYKREGKKNFRVGLYKCHCGNLTEATLRAVKKGNRKTCGCSHTPDGNLPKATIRAYKAMITRCYNKNTPYYKKYGGRGIIVCERWLESYDNFLKDMGIKPTKHYSLDRINNNGNYEPDNCRWATRTEQGNNTRRNIIIEYMGRKQTLPEWAREYNISAELLRSRLKTMDIQRALETPKKVIKYRPLKQKITGCCWLIIVRRNGRNRSIPCNKRTGPEHKELCQKHYQVYINMGVT